MMQDTDHYQCVVRRLFAGLTSLATMFLTASIASAQSPSTETLRYDLPDGDLGAFGLEIALDYLFPPIPARIVNTRFELTFETETPLGSFDAADIGLILQPPIDDPVDPADRVLTLFLTGEDFGWSGAGTFTYSDQTDVLNGPVLDAPPGAGALLYALTLFHANRLTDPNDASPLGGRFVDSFIEIDYVAVPEPATVMLLAAILPAMLLSGAARAGRANRNP
jgi:hypothetical protein